MKQKINTINTTSIFVTLKKSILLVLTLGFITSSSFAGDYRGQESELTISMWNQSSEFIVVLDGYQNKARGIINLNHIKPGKHSIEIIQLHRSRCSNERGKTLLHRGMINVPSQTKMTAVIKPQIGFRIVKVEPRFAQLDQHNHGHNHSDYDHYENDSYYGNSNCSSCDMGCSECMPNMYNDYGSTCDDDSQYDEYDLYTQYMIDNDMYNDNSSTMPYVEDYMSDYEMNNLMNELEEAWFDSDRLQLAKNRIRNKKVSSEQVLRIIEEFSFESSRLEIAKYAFNYTIDQENYYVVNGGLEFSSSVNELENFIN